MCCPKSKKALGFVVLLCLLIALAIDGNDPAFQQEASLYCHMVHLRRSNPAAQLGWPDYKHVYSEQCRVDGSLRKDWNQ